MRRWTLCLYIETNSTATGTMNCIRGEVGNLNSIKLLTAGLAGLDLIGALGAASISRGIAGVPTPPFSGSLYASIRPCRATCRAWGFRRPRCTHLRPRSGPSRRPRWLPVGARLRRRHRGSHGVDCFPPGRPPRGTGSTPRERPREWRTTWCSPAPQPPGNGHVPRVPPRGLPGGRRQPLPASPWPPPSRLRPPHSLRQFRRDQLRL